MSRLRAVDWEALLRGTRGGHDVSAADRRAVELQAGTGAATYGEILPHAARRLLRWLMPGPDDVLFDLGSGSGRVVVQAVFESDVGRACGVELSQDRHASAAAAVEALIAGLDPPAADELRARLELRCEDLRDTDLSDATLVYVAATSFPGPLLAATCRRLDHDAPRLRRIVTTRPLPAPWGRRFPPLGELDLDMSWSPDVRVHVHRAAAARHD